MLELFLHRFCLKYPKVFLEVFYKLNQERVLFLKQKKLTSSTNIMTRRSCNCHSKGL